MSFHKNIFVIDIETTGPDLFEHDVLSIYISPLFGDNPSLELLIDYGNKELNWGNVASRYFKSYKSKWEKQSLPSHECWNTFKKFIDKDINVDEITFAGHNVGFDYSFLKKFAKQNKDTLPKKISHRLFDVHSVLYFYFMKGLIPKSALTSRGSLEYFEIIASSSERHDAKKDVEDIKKVINKLLEFQGLNTF
tara:strand:- start:14272 stop:14850 length:579 start_codon:yes stop_codon:yes gene_type:complete